MTDFFEVVDGDFPHPEHAEVAGVLVVGNWAISPFRYDSSDDSFFWLETHRDGVERMGSTGPNKTGVFVLGQRVEGTSEDFRLLYHEDAERARNMYVHSLNVVGANNGVLPDPYDG